MAEQAWHYKPEITTLLREFHENYARQPTKEIDEAKQRHTLYTDQVARELRAQGKCSRIEYTGSSYEGVKVSNDIEFDIMVIQTAGSRQLTPIPASSPGFYKLKLADGESATDEFKDIVDGNRCLSPVKSVDSFFGTLQKIIDKHSDVFRNVKLIRHGPAVEMDVSRGNDAPWYSVDVVLAYEVELGARKRVFVAKQPTTIHGKTPQEKDTWRLSFSLEEKALFDGMDSDKGCRRHVLRILKVLRNGEVGLKKLTSYHLKTALFYEMKEGRNWNQSELGPRLIGVLRRLYRAMAQGRQPHYFVPQINLLDGIAPKTIENMKCRMERVLRLEPVFRGLFEPKACGM